THPRPTLFPYTTLFRSRTRTRRCATATRITRTSTIATLIRRGGCIVLLAALASAARGVPHIPKDDAVEVGDAADIAQLAHRRARSEEHTSELQSRRDLV